MSKSQTDEKKPVTLPAFLDRNRILSVEQMAQGLKFSVPHLRRLYRSGSIPKPIQIGGKKLGWPAGVLIDMTSSGADTAAAA